MEKSIRAGHHMATRSVPDPTILTISDSALYNWENPVRNEMKIVKIVAWVPPFVLLHCEDGAKA